MAIRSTPRKTTATAKKALPGKAAPAARTAAVKAPTKTAAAPAPRKTTVAKPAPKTAAAPKLTAYDVYRSSVAARKAAEAYEAVRAAFEAQGGAEIQDAVVHAQNFVDSVTPGPREGRRPDETPSAKARAKDPVIGEFYDYDKTSTMKLTELRTLAAELVEEGLITETMKKMVILQQMEDAGLFRAEGNSGSDEDDELPDDEDDEEDEEDEDEEYDEDDDESEDDDDESDDESGGYTIEDLKAMKLAELQDIAENNKIDVEGFSKSEVIAALVAQVDDEDEEEEPDEEDDDEDDEEGEGFQEVTFEDLLKMPVAELVRVAKDSGVKVPVAKKNDKKWLIAAIKKAVGDGE